MARVENVFSKMPISTPDSVHQAIEEGLLVLSYVGTQDYYECLVCHRGMSGSVPAQAHLHGTPHLKALQNSSGTSVVCVPNSSSNLPSNGFASIPCPALSSSSRYQLASSPEQNSTVLSLKPCSLDTDAVVSALRCGIVTEATVSCQRVFTCTICKITCTGNIPMNQHLCGESHCKKESKINTAASNTTRASRPLEAHSFSSQSSTSLASLPHLPSSIELRHLLSEVDDASPDKDLVQSAVVDGTMTPAEEDDFSNLSCEVCQLSCSGATPMKQHLQGAFHKKKMSCDSTSAPGQLSRVHHENKRDSNNQVKGKATKRYTQPDSKMINNELSEVERQPCSTATLQGTRTDLTTLLHRKDLSEETEMILCVLRDLKESVNDLHDNFSNNEVMTKKLDERFSSIEFNTSQNFARQNSEISQLSAKCAVQDRKIADLEEQITFQNGEINHLRNLSTIKDDKITNLLIQMKQLIDQHITPRDEINDQNRSDTE